MGNIVLLDELTINQIAAGEVIERPASVIKEMVENSIDAGAKNITVEIKNGGISFIKITDDGKGIMQDDLEIAFERHATSKIRAAEDLDKVKSMGFRGEALASIASIATVELSSKTEEQENGYKIVIEGGEVFDKDVAACRKGTTIIVRNLFFNTPVRYKFLRKDYTESGYIEDVITRLCLVNPDIAFKLINTGKTVIQTNGSGKLSEVVYAIFGKEIASALIPVSATYEDIQVEGVIGKPEIARSNRSKQLYFVNKRFIKDKSIGAAIEQAYKGMIPIGKFGFVALNMTINPAKVDVNVHPAKTEVRFEEESKVFQAIFHAIKDSLLSTELVENTSAITKQEKEGNTDKPLKVNPRSVSFEERLRQLKEHKKEEKSKLSNLFSGRKHEAEQGAKYEEETKNNILSEIAERRTGLGGYHRAEDNVAATVIEKEVCDAKVEEIANSISYTEGNTVNTSDVLEKLKELTEKVEEEKEEIESLDIEKKKALMEESESYVVNSQEDALKDVLDNANLAMDSEVAGEISIDKNEPSQEISSQDNNCKDVKPSFEEMYEKMFGSSLEHSLEKKANNEFIPSARNETIFEEKYKKMYKIVGVVFNTYIILEIEDIMYILDQHAAHERVLYEKVKDNYFNMKNETQFLLLPDVITLTHKEMTIVKENWYLFENTGFEMEEFGENTIKLVGVPAICLDLDNEELFLETLDQINSVARTSKEEKEERFIATVACKAAVKAKMILDTKEIEVLLNDLLRLTNPFTCPHGRPIAIKMDKRNIERKVGR